MGGLLLLVACAVPSDDDAGLASRVSALEAALADAEARADALDQRLSQVETAQDAALEDLDARIGALESGSGGSTVASVYDVDCNASPHTLYDPNGGALPWCVVAVGVDPADPPWSVRVQSIVDNRETYPDGWYTQYGNDAGWSFGEYPLYNPGESLITDEGRLISRHGGRWRVVLLHDRAYAAP